MMIPRFLAIVLLVIPCAAPLAAQSATDGLPSLAPLFGAPAPVTDFRTRIPPLAMRLPGAATPGQLQLQLAKSALIQPSTAPFTMKWQALGAPIPIQRLRFALRALAKSRDACYAMRSYRIKRDNPDSDVTSFAGYSTCQAATEFQAKSAGGLIFPAR